MSAITTSLIGRKLNWGHKSGTICAVSVVPVEGVNAHRWELLVENDAGLLFRCSADDVKLLPPEEKP
jgi:hypothetical protein